MRVLVICGPTGVGKTDVAVMLARRHRLEIISADSRQVYRHLDIGTAKPPPEVQREVKFHMIDHVEPDRLYSAADYARDALQIMRELKSSGRRFIVVGGSGFYLRALFQPFFEAPRYNPELRAHLNADPTASLYSRLQQVDPVRASQLHPHDRQRIIRALEIYELTGRRFSELTRERAAGIEFTPVYVVLNIERKRLYARIEERFEQMLAAGLLDEVRRLKQMGLEAGSYVTNAYGYAELLAYLEGKITLEEAVREAKRKTRAYARRQLIWFRKLKDARWLEFSSAEEVARRLEPLLLDVLEKDGNLLKG